MSVPLAAYSSAMCDLPAGSAAAAATEEELDKFHNEMTDKRANRSVRARGTASRHTPTDTFDSIGRAGSKQRG